MDNRQSCFSWPNHSSADLDEGTPQQIQQSEKLAKDLFVSFHCYCSRKEINCRDILLEDGDKVRAITDYVSSSAIENLVVGAASRNGFMSRFKTDLPTTVSKSAPDFCNVYVISKGKIASVRNASRPAPYHSSMQQSEIDNPITPEKAPKNHDQSNSADHRYRRESHMETIMNQTATFHSSVHLLIVTLTYPSLAQGDQALNTLPLA